MNNPIKIILIATLVIAVFSIFNKKPLEDIVLPEDLSEIISPIENVQSYTIDFNECSKDLRIEIPSKTGLSRLVVKEKTSTDCLVETIFETKGGFYTNECAVPNSLRAVTFKGDNFEEIASYCEINSTGTGLLELK